MIIKKTHYGGVWKSERRGRKLILTKNLNLGKKVYGEKLFDQDGIEYREWNPERSKLGAAIHKGVQITGIKEKDKVLYLGAAYGTTVSHVSDIVGEKGFIFGLDFAQRVMRDFIFLCEERKNIAPIYADANKPEEYFPLITPVDVVFMDVAQRDQAEIFLKNTRLFLKKGGYALLAVKARSIDVSKKPDQIYKQIQQKLNKELEIVDFRKLDPFEVDHCIFVCKKK